MNAWLNRMLDAYERGALSRRDLLAGLTGVAAAGVAPPPPPPRPREGSTFRGVNLNHLALRVTDIPRSRAFYQKHLGLTVASEGEQSCFLRCRERDFVAMFRSQTPGMDHFCFSIDRYEPAAAVAKLSDAGLEPRRRGDRVYFDDPDGIEVQVAAREHRV
ncbi:MAG: hypothetical protein HKO59_04030 [Phycisphaerales bacterium]|nr:VOC family protein [Phycisphaerae bacterium]NNF42655.1 hypothetical protein [Phycisphaerales bacterium]NNM25150.1 hypothetical protein [Phycisphaerales bacterium]